MVLTICIWFRGSAQKNKCCITCISAWGYAVQLGGLGPCAGSSQRMQAGDCTSLVSELVDAEVQDDALTTVPPIELCMALARRWEKIMAPSAAGRLGRSQLCLP